MRRFKCGFKGCSLTGRGSEGVLSLKQAQEAAEEDIQLLGHGNGTPASNPPTPTPGPKPNRQQPWQPYQPRS